MSLCVTTALAGCGGGVDTNGLGGSAGTSVGSAGSGGVGAGGAAGTGVAGGGGGGAGAGGAAAGSGGGATAGKGGGAGGAPAGGAGGAPVGGAGGAPAGGAGGAPVGGAGGAPVGGSGGAPVGGAGGGAIPVALTAPSPVGFAVLNSNFKATSVSLLNISGGLAKSGCIYSVTSGGSATISGDVVLPTQPQRGNQLVLLDRGNSALTFLNANCEITRQFSVKGGLTLPNPHDVVIVSDTKAYVTRYERNSTTGDDIYIVDPVTGTSTGRIDLSSYAAPVAGMTIQARPDRAVIANGKVMVTLNSTSPSYPYTYAEGRLVVVDPATDTVAQNLALTGLKNCEGLEYLPAAKLVLVSCAGTFDSPDQALESGIAVVDVATTPVMLKRTISGQAFAAGPVTFLWVLGAPTATQPNRAFTATFGSFAPEAPDLIQMFDFVSGAAKSIASSSAYGFGRPAVGAGRLLIPDAAGAQPTIQVFDITGTPTKTSAFTSDTVKELPPREIAAY